MQPTALQLVTCVCSRSSLKVRSPQPGTGHEGARQWKAWISDARKSSSPMLPKSAATPAGSSGSHSPGVLGDEDATPLELTDTQSDGLGDVDKLVLPLVHADPLAVAT